MISQPASALRPRMLLPGDGTACARLMRKVTPLDDKLDRELAKILDRLLEEERLIGGLIEDYDAKGDRTAIAATLSAFVPPEFREAYLDRPWPCLTNWLLLRCLKGDTELLLDRVRQGRGNLATGLDLVMLDYIQSPMDFTSPEVVAGSLSVSRDAVKQTWRSIYDHVTQVMPDLVDRGQMGAGEGARGQEKRRRIVAYVRDNAQELRPHYLRRG